MTGPAWAFPNAASKPLNVASRPSMKHLPLSGALCRNARPAASLVKQLATALLLAATLAACGGGDPEPEPDVPTPGVDCKTNPKACA